MRSLFSVFSRSALAGAAVLLFWHVGAAHSSDWPTQTTPGSQSSGEGTLRPAWLGTSDDPGSLWRGSRAHPLGLSEHAFEFLGRLHEDFRVQFEFPFRYAKRRPRRFLLGAMGITALIFTDHSTQEILASKESLQENQLVEPAARLSRWGNTSSALPLVMGIGAVGLAFDSPRERETSLLLVEALLTSATWTQVIKMIGGRERPREKQEAVADWEGPDIFNNDLKEVGFRSFPSGHSTGIWAAATILANQYPEYRLVPILGYGTAVAMSYSRMAVGAHWLSDVVVGGLIGYGCAKQVLSASEARRIPRNEAGVRFGFDVTGDYQGVSVRYGF